MSARRTLSLPRPLRRPLSRVGALAATAITVAVATAGVGTATAAPHHASGSSASSAAGAAKRIRPTVPFEPTAGIFGPTSAWHLDVTSAPLNTDSAAIVSNLSAQVANHWGGVAAFNYNTYTTGFYAVHAGHPRHDVHFDDCQHKGYTPSQLYTPSAGAAFSQVPIPANAIPSPGTDAELSVWDRSTDQLWEFWKANHQSDGWHACWGGRIDHVSQSQGYFPNGTGATATGLAVSGGVIGMREARAGVINHAIGLVVINAAHYTDFSYPAQRSDGADPAGEAGAIPEGLRLRLDPSVDIDSLGLTPIAHEIAVAAQKYGFIVEDKGGAVAVTAESGAGVAAKRGADPWTALRGGVPGYSIMKNFPWGSLQALPMDYGEPTPSS